MLPVLWVVLAAVAAPVVGWPVATRRSGYSDTAGGFAALGAVTGLMIGLSTTPIVASVVTAVLGAVIALIPIYFPRAAAGDAAAAVKAEAVAAARRESEIVAGEARTAEAEKQEADQRTVAESAEKTEAKKAAAELDPKVTAARQAEAAARRVVAAVEAVGTSLPPLGLWLFPFAAALLVGVVGGLVLRVNDALNFAPRTLADQYRAQGFDDAQVKAVVARQAKVLSGQNLREQYKDQGFNDQQVDAIMAQHAKAITGPPPKEPPPPKPPDRPDRPYLQSAERPANWDLIWAANHNPDQPDASVTRLYGAVGDRVRGEIDRMRRDGVSAADILKRLNDEFSRK